MLGLHCYTGFSLVALSRFLIVVASFAEEHWFQAWALVAAVHGDGQGSLACCSPWGRRESDMAERLN